MELPEKIVEEIKNRALVPRPRWQFLLKRSVVWSLALFAIALGGIAVAIIIFIFIDHGPSTRVYLGESIFEDLLQTIPYVWVGTLCVLVGISQYAIRHANFGYRYTTSRILLTVVMSSMVLGVALNALEVGERTQDFLVQRVPYYDDLIYTSKDAWSHPEKGLLSGTVTAISSATEFELTDFAGKKWTVDFEKANEGTTLVQEGTLLKIVGAEEDMSTFRAVRILSWK